MFQPTRITFAGSVVYCYDPENDYDFQIEPKYLMQYTGLKDKNGVEIYEGDILTTDGKNHGTFVVWATESACWAFTRKHSDTITPLFHEDYWSSEVIGNIHENPDLLGGEK